MDLLRRALILAALLSFGALAQQPSLEEAEELFEAKSAFEVNEGELVFLVAPPAKSVHHHHNWLVLDDGSTLDGWAHMTQCHENLDRVPRAQIVFRDERIRDLTVTEYRNIGRAWVEGPTVQLEDVGPQAWLCLSAESLALVDNGDGTYSLQSGPFMRRFLDGYYPMHVSMQVKLATDKLRPAGVVPADQPGFAVWEGLDEVRFETWFEGRLITEIRFRLADH
jgi:hypothetical protein